MTTSAYAEAERPVPPSLQYYALIIRYTRRACCPLVRLRRCNFLSRECGYSVHGQGRIAARDGAIQAPGLFSDRRRTVTNERDVKELSPQYASMSQVVGDRNMTFGATGSWTF